MCPGNLISRRWASDSVTCKESVVRNRIEAPRAGLGVGSALERWVHAVMNRLTSY
jgi:hypothetical protein